MTSLLSKSTDVCMIALLCNLADVYNYLLITAYSDAFLLLPMRRV